MELWQSRAYKTNEEQINLNKMLIKYFIIDRPTIAKNIIQLTQ